MKRRLLIVGLIAIFGLYMLSFSATRPRDLGVTNGQLLPLPDSPNAVSTQTDDTSRRMPFLELDESVEDQMTKIEEVILNMPRTVIVQKTENYLHAEFRSLIFRFVDDVEFFVDENEKRIHFRSASRIGHSDLGTNRSRMERIVAALQD